MNIDGYILASYPILRKPLMMKMSELQGPHFGSGNQVVHGEQSLINKQQWIKANRLEELEGIFLVKG